MSKLNKFRPQNLIPKEDLKEIMVYSSTSIKDEHYDPERKVSVSEAEVNPTPIRGYCYDASYEGLIIRAIGLKTTGAKEIIVSSMYKELLEECSKVEIDSISYEVYKTAGGSKGMLIKNLPHKRIKILLVRK